MKVHIIGPNLLDQSKGSFHVHAEGCADVHRNAEYQLPDFASDREHTYDVTSRVDAAGQVYSDQIGEGSMTAADGVNDLWFAPCTDALPHKDPFPVTLHVVTFIQGHHSRHSTEFILTREGGDPKRSVEVLSRVTYPMHDPKREFITEVARDMDTALDDGEPTVHPPHGWNDHVSYRGIRSEQ